MTMMLLRLQGLRPQIHSGDAETRQATVRPRPKVGLAMRRTNKTQPRASRETLARSGARSLRGALGEDLGQGTLLQPKPPRGLQSNLNSAA